MTDFIDTHDPTFTLRTIEVSVPPARVNPPDHFVGMLVSGPKGGILLALRMTPGEARQLAGSLTAHANEADALDEKARPS